MGVFDTIRSILGLDGSSDDEKTELTVESESSDDPDIDESAAAGADATASTDSMTETPSSDPETAAEPAEAAGPATDDMEPETAENIEDDLPDVEDADDEPESDTEAADESGGDSDGESVETVSGIGPAYAERLADAGVETIEELRVADASELAEQTELSEKRIAGWQEQVA